MLITLSLFVLVGQSDVARGEIILWYNGDVSTGGTVNEETTNLGAFNIYDDFVVTDPSGWTIERVWSNNSMQITGVDHALWSIRSGMADGIGGTIIAGGTSSATQTPTGRTNPNPGFFEYSIEVAGLNVFLAPGTYWLSVSPLVGVDTGSVYKSYASLTLKANAVGTPATNNGNSFLNSAHLGQNYQYKSNDYSMGVAGSSASIPEPSTFAVMVIGLIGLAGYRCRRRRR
jgi:hypothetical protein